MNFIDNTIYEKLDNEEEHSWKDQSKNRFYNGIRRIS